ncbi:hypothetical protein [Chitinilyticum aquatile]|uniref:hypothetical protein n=1 Tax=Chitinilyticum aquatile TaxID=362520 RepID=UPI0003FF2BE7|nr:hypothetical protein [Chitinilyticum aquatile]
MTEHRQEDYLDTLCLAGELLVFMQRRGSMALEGELDDWPHGELASRYPVASQPQLAGLVCDLLRLLASGERDPAELQHYAHAAIHSYRDENSAALLYAFWLVLRAGLAGRPAAAAIEWGRAAIPHASKPSHAELQHAWRQRIYPDGNPLAPERLAAFIHSLE